MLQSMPSILQQATTNPCLRWRLPDTHRHVWNSLLWSLFLSPGSWCTRCCCALQESISQSCVSSGSSMVGLMATSSKRAYAIPSLLHPEPLTLQQFTADLYLCKRHSQFCLSLCGVSGSWCTRGVFEPSECLWWEWGLILNTNLPLLPSCWGFFFALGHRVSPHGCSLNATQPPCSSYCK